METSGAGFTILKVVRILADGPESLIDVMMSSGFCSVLVQPPAGASATTGWVGLRGVANG